MNITLKQIKKGSHLSADRFKKLLTALGKTRADNAPLSLIAVLDGNGLDDALLCLRALDGYDKEIRMYADWCAKQVQHLMIGSNFSNSFDGGYAASLALFFAGDFCISPADAAMNSARYARKAAWDGGYSFGSVDEYSLVNAINAASAAMDAQEKEFRRVFK
jgi:hypothetical protein